MEAETNPTQMRMSLALIGALAGVSFWYLGELFSSEIEETRWLLFASAGAFGFFSTFLALIGPLTLRVSAGAALMLGLIAASLLTLASFRFPEVWSITIYGHEIISYFMVLFLSLPFVIAQMTSESKWRDYEALFDQSWTIVVRYAAAFLFVGVSWLIVYFCDALLSVVGIPYIGDILEVDFVPFVFTGVALGAAVAVVNELSDYVSAFLIIRLFRLILPVFTLVVIVFIVALPIRGVGHLFGDLSPAATLMSIAALVMLFVSSAVDRDDECAVKTPLMSVATRLLALTLPVLSGVALYSIWVRVIEYGWTPDRVDAAVVGVLFLAYGFSYLVPIVRVRNDWMSRIRRANVFLALGGIAIAMLSLTPVLNPKQISTSSQVSRYATGYATAAELDLWAMKHEWGIAGQDALVQLRGMAENDPNLATQLERLDLSRSRYAFETNSTDALPAQGWAQVRDVLPVVPTSSSLPQQIGFSQSASIWEQVLEGCAILTSEGHPACVAISVELLEGNSAEEIIVLFANGVDEVQVIGLRPDRLNARQYDLQIDPTAMLGQALSQMPIAVIDRVHGGEFSIEPSGANILRLESNSIFIQP
ncbi:DUF4153 domain-containing protein [Cochlodiniinecator piscidefendens]|uniref:DUF4153 domain-containing protein n=1 Tax=Cochlodiniinecator piscidefendens TaxID=2715756 RepID=UPI00140B622F|nr:DUF4153 domain-containing protein [Cochlodiniinecator piscidefendens]